MTPPWAHAAWGSALELAPPWAQFALARIMTPPWAHAAWSPALWSWMPPPLPAERTACGPPSRGPVPVSCSRLASALELASPWAQFAVALERSPPWAQLAWALEATPPWAQGVLALEMTPPWAHASLVLRAHVLVRGCASVCVP